MPNVIDATGCQIATRQEIIDQLLDGGDGFPGLRAIYGADINVDPNTPDGQMVNLFAQITVDYLEQLQQIFNSMDPDQAIGTVLDERCAINGVVRLAGTHTQQVVSVTVTAAVTLPGLDTAPANPFTVSDQNGNQYQLLAATSFSGASSLDCAFQAKNLGAVTSAPGNITEIVTTTANVISVTNAAGPSTLGINEETDYALRIRRSNSVAVPSKGYLFGLYGALLAIDGVLFANIQENDTAGTVGGIPSHSIWVIVDAANTTELKDAIAEAIYVHRNAGCGMKGGQSILVEQIDGTFCVIKFDLSTAEPLWFHATVTAITGSVDKPFIAAQVLATFGHSYGIGVSADASAIVAYIKEIAPNASVSVAGVSDDNITFSPLVAPTGVNYQFDIPDAAHITIS